MELSVESRAQLEQRVDVLTRALSVHKGALPSREEALMTMKKHTSSTSLRGHMLAVEESMRAYARKLGEDEEIYGITGLLHDHDYEEHPDPVEHPVVGCERLLQMGYPVAVIEAIMGHDLILGSLSARIVRPGDGLQSLHSDVPLGLHRYQPDPPVMMNTIWALDDFTPGNGGTRVVPGSHQSRLHEPPAGFDVPFVAQPELRAGSVLVIHGQTWHGGGANTSTGNRHAMFGHYRVDTWMRFQCDPHHQFEEPWLDLLTDRQRELLRMQHGLSDKLAADFYER